MQYRWPVCSNPRYSNEQTTAVAVLTSTFCNVTGSLGFSSLRLASPSDSSSEKLGILLRALLGTLFARCIFLLVLWPRCSTDALDFWRSGQKASEPKTCNFTLSKKQIITHKTVRTNWCNGWLQGLCFINMRCETVIITHSGFICETIAWTCSRSCPVKLLNFIVKLHRNKYHGRRGRSERQLRREGSYCWTPSLPRFCNLSNEPFRHTRRSSMSAKLPPLWLPRRPPRSCTSW